MSELTSNQYLIIITVLVFISIVMLFLLSRSDIIYNISMYKYAIEYIMDTG